MGGLIRTHYVYMYRCIHIYLHFLHCQLPDFLFLEHFLLLLLLELLLLLILHFLLGSMECEESPLLSIFLVLCYLVFYVLHKIYVLHEIKHRSCLYVILGCQTSASFFNSAASLAFVAVRCTFHAAARRACFFVS